ncbi:MAG: molybdopterin-dependent oxidoreductase, partial [Gemmatimonadota bacterium]
AANESLFYLRELLNRIDAPGGVFRAPTGEEEVLAGFPKLALRSERAPNATGAELFGFERTPGPLEVPDGGCLVVLEELLDEEPESWAESASFFLYAGSRIPPAARAADAILPVTGFAEMEGSFTNFEGRVQRFGQALRPPGLARPAWLVLARLVAELDARTGPSPLGTVPLEVQEAFRTMGAATPELAGLTWEALGAKGALPDRAGRVAAEIP